MKAYGQQDLENWRNLGELIDNDKSIFALYHGGGIVRKIQFNQAAWTGHITYAQQRISQEFC